MTWSKSRNSLNYSTSIFDDFWIFQTKAWAVCTVLRESRKSGLFWRWLSSYWFVALFVVKKTEKCQFLPQGIIIDQNNLHFRNFHQIPVRTVVFKKEFMTWSKSINSLNYSTSIFDVFWIFQTETWAVCTVLREPRKSGLFWRWFSSYWVVAHFTVKKDRKMPISPWSKKNSKERNLYNLASYQVR